MDTKIGVETSILFDEITALYYPDSPAVAQFREPIKEEVYEYWIDPYEVWYYYSIGAIQRHVYNYYDNPQSHSQSTFQKQMDRALTNYGNLCFKSGLDVIRVQSKKVQEYVEKFKPTIWDNKTNQELEYHIEYYWETNGPNPCDFCKAQDGKNLIKIDVLKAHWNCRCQIVQKEWYTDKNGNKYYESEKTL